MKYCPSGKTQTINACGSLTCSFIVTYVMLTTFIASFPDQGLFLEMWGGWMLSSDVAGVLQEAGDAYSRART